SNANLSRADLHNARDDGAEFSGAQLDSTIWINRQRCRPGSVGTCQ
ncbi:MAG: pentapeptide repeat-containing protein, partial [Candidatus Competibacteraceae bacterium]|nr:pentapeptide repeat-containing protein [Candidatus Competibacteraceae bacterium]